MIDSHVHYLHLCGRARVAGKAISEEAARVEWESVDVVREESARPLVESLVSMFDQQAAAAVRNLPGLLRDSFGRTKDPTLPSLEEITNTLLTGAEAGKLIGAEWDDWLIEQLPGLLNGIATAGYDTGIVRVGIDLDELVFDLTNAQRDVLEHTIAQVQGINAESRRQLAQIIAEGLLDDQDASEIAAAIKRQFQDWEDWRAQTIAQTAATPAFEVGQLEAYTLAGIDQMSWLSQRDGRVRTSHQQVDGEEIQVGGTFSNGLRYPGDVLGSPSETINCRCATRPVVTRSKSATFNDREAQRIDLAIRDATIRHLYPGMKDLHGQAATISALSERYHVSESTVKRAIWG